MQPAEIDFTHWQNADWALAVLCTDQNDMPHDFSGSTFAMHIKTVAAGAVVLPVTVDTSQIAEGRIGLSFADGALPLGSYVHDLVRITGGVRELIFYGKFVMLQGVTQP